jgi:hypothetical protein
VRRFYVLTDSPGRIYIESGGGALAFGNVWAPRDAIIFKGSPPASGFLCVVSFRHPCRRPWKALEVKASSDSISKTHLTCGIVDWILQRQMMPCRSRYGTGEN